MLYEIRKEDTAPNKRGTANLQYLARKQTDKNVTFNFGTPPSNDEIEVIGIEVRLPDKKSSGKKSDKVEEIQHQASNDGDEALGTSHLSDRYFREQNTNINNYVCLVRFNQDAGSIAYHMPYVIPLKDFQDHLGYFSAASQKLIGEYVISVYEALRTYNGIYWTKRYSIMNYLSQ
jgi:hypothetical protein